MINISGNILQAQLDVTRHSGMAITDPRHVQVGNNCPDSTINFTIKSAEQIYSLSLVCQSRKCFSDMKKQGEVLLGFSVCGEQKFKLILWIIYTKKLNMLKVCKYFEIANRLTCLLKFW